MIGQGIHYAVTPGQMAALLEAAPRGDEAVLDALYVIEGVGDRKTRGGKGAGLIAQSTDRAWELIHRALTRDRTPRGRLNPRAGRYPLSRCVLGGLHLKRGGCIMASLTRPEEVADAAAAVARLDEPALRRRALALDPAVSEFGLGEENLRYLWHWFEKLAAFYARAAGLGRAVVFKADRCELSREPRY